MPPLSAPEIRTMNRAELIRQVVARFLGLFQEGVLLEGPLHRHGLRSSIQCLKLHALLEEATKQRVPPITTDMTLAEIVMRFRGEVMETATAATTANATAPHTSSARPSPPSTDGQHPSREMDPSRFSREPSSSQSPHQKWEIPPFFVGIDIEEVANLPETDHYRATPFYRDNFSSREIATALLKPSPRITFCGWFCAKEALKKALPEVTPLRLSEIEIHEAAGRPRITTIHPRINQRYQLQLSISHTEHTAVAVVHAFQVRHG
ncbi:MAG: 4'-phosphopantetheinyl transferase superfamily protein [Magnetococcales bacterium]|nr:4'-phosphopantetheinyl transferase superfamily protein [Magnetococcales bacterium]